MKRALLLLLLVCASARMLVCGQSHIRVWQGGESDRMKIANVGDMSFAGSNLTIKGTTYSTASIDSIIVVPEVTVQYSGTTATVNIPDAVAAYVTASVSGAHVTLTNTNTANEMEIVLSGTSADGSFTYNGSYKCTIELNGLTLTSTKGAALDIECGKRVALVLADGTTNSLADAASGSQKACLYCKGHLEIEDGGTLTVSGNAAHAISAKEYILLKKSTGTINIAASQKNGINTSEDFQMRGGTVNMDVTVQDGKGIKADSTITVSGGTIAITASGNGSRGIQTDQDMLISQDHGTTNITVAATGTNCTLAECSDDPHRCMGIKVDGNLTINAGTVTVTNTGKKSRGIKVGGTYTKNGGTVSASITN